MFERITSKKYGLPNYTRHRTTLHRHPFILFFNLRMKGMVSCFIFCALLGVNEIMNDWNQSLQHNSSLFIKYIDNDEEEGEHNFC
jgi:hypothetical protein